MKPLLRLAIAATLLTATAFAQAPVSLGKYYALWPAVPQQGIVAVLSKDKVIPDAYVRIVGANEKSDWVQVLAYPSEMEALIAMMTSEMEANTELSKKFLAALGKTKEELLEQIKKDSAKTTKPAELWINTSRITAITELKFDPDKLAKKAEPKK